jgi:probable selenium-dependent hydroxylase accessory protein YqeC
MSDAMLDLYATLKDAALSLSGRRSPGRGLVFAFVGAGGKTSALFALAEAARRGGAGRVAIATTTKMRDPRFEEGRRFDRLFVDPRLGEEPEGRDAEDLGAMRELWRGPSGETVAMAARAFAEGDARKIGGLHPCLASPIAMDFDLVLVEADGARGRSIKAAGEGEPVVPACADAVLGLVGLDCIGEKLGDGIAHRPERLGALVACAPGERILPRHVAALAASPQGLFKGCPPGAARIALLNKAELADRASLLELVGLIGKGASAGLGPDLVVACSFREGRVELVSGSRYSGAGSRPGAEAI